MSATSAVQQVIADLRCHWPSQVEICVAADLLETQQAMLAEKDETIAELREEIDRCHARLEIDHVFTGGGKQEDGGFLRVEVPMGERKSLPDAVACRDDTIELQGEQIAELRARCEQLEQELLRSPSVTKFEDGSADYYWSGSVRRLLNVRSDGSHNFAARSDAQRLRQSKAAGCVAGMPEGATE